MVHSHWKLKHQTNNIASVTARVVLCEKYFLKAVEVFILIKNINLLFWIHSRRESKFLSFLQKASYMIPPVLRSISFCSATISVLSRQSQDTLQVIESFLTAFSSSFFMWQILFGRQDFFCNFFEKVKLRNSCFFSSDCALHYSTWTIKNIDTFSILSPQHLQLLFADFAYSATKSSYVTSVGSLSPGWPVRKKVEN